MTPRALLLQAARQLREKGIPDPENDGALLLSDLTGRAPLDLRADMDTELPEETVSAFERMLRRRMEREPLQYILGYTFFRGIRFHTDARALIPRPETEALTGWALEESRAEGSPAVLDLCCGTGCIGLSFLKERPKARVTMTDISGEALTLAKENATALGLQAECLKGDLLKPVKGRLFDLILSNPPYIPTEECRGLQKEVLQEPVSALDGGDDGLDFYRRILREAPAHLRPGGRIFLEMGYQEAPAIRRLAEENGAEQVEIRKDFSGLERMLMAVYR